MTKNLGQYPAINEIGRARQATLYLGYSVRQGCKPHVLSWNSTAAISLLKIRRVTQIKKNRSVQWKKLKKMYNFPIRYLAHIIHWYDKCIQRREPVLICSSIRFIEHESAFVWLQKRTLNYCTYFAISHNIVWTCSTRNSVQQINSKHSLCLRYNV